MKKKVVNSSRMPIYRDAGFELNDSITTSDAFKKESEHERDPEKPEWTNY